MEIADRQGIDDPLWLVKGTRVNVSSNGCSAAGRGFRVESSNDVRKRRTGEKSELPRFNWRSDGKI